MSLLRSQLRRHLSHAARSYASHPSLLNSASASSIPALNASRRRSRTIRTASSTQQQQTSTQSPSSSSSSPSWIPSLGLSIPSHCSSIDPFRIVSKELEQMTQSIQDTVSILKHPVLHTAACHLINLEGKRVRPIMVLLMAHSTAMLSVAESAPSLLPTQLRLAEITELIHAASLLHDDVIDVADTRRGSTSVNSAFGNQLAVLAGDFLLARASITLASLRDCDVVQLLSTVIEHLVRGELIQMMPSSFTSLHSYPQQEQQQHDWFQQPGTPFQAYLSKTFYKTASLLANSCRAVAVLAGHSAHVCDAAYRYGENIGMTFQLIDDVLDMTSDSDVLGKPVLNDLYQGHATAPVLFALEQFGEIEEMMERKFKHENDVERTIELVEISDGIGKTRQLAKQHAQQAVNAIVSVLPASDHRSALVNLADFALTRER